MPSEKFRPIICVDFDGVIHSYDKGWQDGSIYGEVVPGFFDWLCIAKHSLDIVVYSSRSRDPGQNAIMQEWLTKRWHFWRDANDLEQMILPVTFASEKPAAWLTIDDRAITFKGDWFAPELRPTTIWGFRPWNAPR
jgi:hypothetical protein